MNQHPRHVLAAGSVVALLAAGCGGTNNDTADGASSDDVSAEDVGTDTDTSDDGADGGVSGDTATDAGDDDIGEDDSEPDETSDNEPSGGDEESGDVAGEEPGVVLLADPVTYEEAGLELEVDAVRIVSIEELEEISGENLTDYLEDASAVTFVGMRVTVRNTTDGPVDWYPGGSGSAIVLDGQQGGPNLLGDWGDEIRAGAELELNPYYESRVPVDEARAAGTFTWDAGEAYDEDFNTLADPELTITYSY